MVNVGRYELPTIDLEDALQRLSKARNNLPSRAAKRDVFGEAMGLKGIGGQTSHVISSMVMYGLVDTGGGEVRITDLGELTLFGNPDEMNSAKAKAINNVEIFKDIYQTYGTHPTDDQLKAFLRQKAMVSDLQQIPILSERIGKQLIKHAGYSSAAQGGGTGTDRTGYRPFQPEEGRGEKPKMEEIPSNVVEVRYGDYQLRIPAEDFGIVKAQFDAALAYLKQKLTQKAEDKQ